MPPSKLNLATFMSLPTMDAVSIQVLGQELLAVAQIHDDQDGPAKKNKKGANDAKARRPLPDHVNEALDDVEREVERLTVTLGATPGGPPKIRAIDLRMDRVIRALEGICDHWSLLAGEIPHGETARALHERLFSDGLEWITLAPRKQWGVMDAKLRSIDDDKLGPRLDELGLTPVLALAQRLHAEYGQTVGVTAPRQPPESPEVRERMDELAEAIRTYSLRVVGMYKRSQPETAALVQALLAPIEDQRRRRRKAGDADSGQDGESSESSGG